MAPISKHIEALKECDLISNLKIPNFELIRLAVKEERLLQGISIVTVISLIRDIFSKDNMFKVLTNSSVI